METVGTVSSAEDDATRVRALLAVHVGEVQGEVQMLTGGFFSRAYAARAGGADYVVRLNGAEHAAGSFAKDAYAFQHFASAALPIPRTLATGAVGADAFSITERMPGQILLACSDVERRAALPALLDTLDAIGSVDVCASRGAGDWGGDGHGRYPSWHAYLTTIIENDAEGYYANWHAFYDESFLEREVYEAVYQHMLTLLPYCPETRGLIHNDYWFMNVLGEGERITGVIDWANALYGDPLYDIARLSWGSAAEGWWYADGAELLRARYGYLPNYEERLACYVCHIGLDDLRFYVKTGNRAQHDYFRDRLLALIPT